MNDLVPQWFIFVLASLACFRLSHMAADESGPFFIFRRLRKAPPAKSATKEGLNCQWCLSIYAAAAITFFLWWMGIVPLLWLPLYWLAVSATAMMVNQQWFKN